MRTLILALALGAVACTTSDYIYEPAEHANARVEGVQAADYAIPPENPAGDIRLATFGISEITPQGAPDGAKLKALHLRAIIANNSDQTWTFDTREQRLTLADRGESRAAFATADAGTPPPTVEIAPKGKRTVDLFFPMPRDLQNESKLPAFDALWTVHTAATTVLQRTPFERLAIKPPAYYEYGWSYWGGSPYWFDPYYPAGAWPDVSTEPYYIHREVEIGRPVYVPPAPPPPSPKSP
jgi:hypothetical protein